MACIARHSERQCGVDHAEPRPPHRARPAGRRSCRSGSSRRSSPCRPGPGPAITDGGVAGDGRGLPDCRRSGPVACAWRSQALRTGWAAGPVAARRTGSGPHARRAGDATCLNSTRPSRPCAGRRRPSRRGWSFPLCPYLVGVHGSGYSWRRWRRRQSVAHVGDDDRFRARRGSGSLEPLI